MSDRTVALGIMRIDHKQTKGAARAEGWLMPWVLGFQLVLLPFGMCAQNSVPNSSFEEFTICPQTIGFQPGGKPLHWEKWLWSPEYFNSCAGALNDVDTLLDVPLNGFGYQLAFDGEGYVGMATFQDDYREYVGCELITPLETGETYELSFRANVATGGNYYSNLKLASNNLGLLFTMEPNIWTGLSGPPFAFRNYAHLHSTAVLADTVAWTEVSGTFVADSAYRYLVIGNFFEDALTDTLGLQGFSTYAAYYFVDAVCVRPIGGTCEFTSSMNEGVFGGASIWPVPVNDVLHIRGESGRYDVEDVLGRSIVSGVMSEGVQVELQVASWPAGQYVLRTDSGLATKKFVVAH